MDVTAKFQSSIPYTLQSVSPTLAALHTRKNRRLLAETTGPDSENSCCGKCGLYLFAGDSSTRVVRMKNARRRRKGGTNAPTPTHRTSSNTRARQSTCFQCGWVTEFPLDREPASLFPIQQTSSFKAADLLNIEQLHVPSKSFQTPNDAPRASSSQSIVQGETVSRQLPPTSSQLPNSGFSVPSVQGSRVTSAPKSRSRPKKKNGLHEMLAQNRAKEEKAKNASNSGQSGLAAFLNSL
ncbi:hypothetical protein C8J55DRAFT_560153 [Lentinula edodes]|uniref:Uncharacterized protein n=1 Tax=Lentinula lateritia TaxID=40482 RepID=A0A9W9DQL0_9AGAR|nr:hypothetical protein C8J55DRAFT_560153 [Lentinula edodes]